MPLYGLLKKGWKFKWEEKAHGGIRKVKENISSGARLLTLIKFMYEEGVPIYVIVTSPTKIRWIINQENEEER